MDKTVMEVGCIVEGCDGKLQFLTAKPVGFKQLIILTKCTKCGQEYSAHAKHGEPIEFRFCSSL